jgi:phage baseplate assembly protein W
MKSISIPFRFENGVVASTTDNDKIARQRIADVLATNSFERVMRPEYGAGISNLLFEPLDPLIFADYKIDAINILNDGVSNARIQDLQIREGNGLNYNDSGDSTLVVNVVYSVANSGTATYTITLDGTRILTEESEI